MQCNEKGEIYVNGVKMGETTTSSDVLTSVIPRTTRLIAIKGYHGAGTSYIAASFTNTSFQTTTQWKCSTQDMVDSTDWAEVTFDDSDWGSADKVGVMDSDARFEQAEKIWKGSEEGAVYCRGWMGEY